MILSDTGPLVSLVNAKDKNHQACVLALARLSRPLLTTWPCFAEAMYLCHRNGGFPAQRALWQFVRSEILKFHVNGDAEIARMQILMEQYRDTPMDLADASLVVAAESLNLTRVFTLDSDFHVYRLESGIALQIVP